MSVAAEAVVEAAIEAIARPQPSVALDTVQMKSWEALAAEVCPPKASKLLLCLVNGHAEIGRHFSGYRIRLILLPMWY